MLPKNVRPQVVPKAVKILVKQSENKVTPIIFCAICIIFILLILLNNYSGKRCVFDTDRCYVNSKYIYIVNELNGKIHIFNMKGTCIKKVNVITKGGVVWSKYDDALYIYSVRTNIEMCINGEKITEKKTFYGNPNEFYTTNNSCNQNIATLKNDMVYLPSGDSVLLIQEPE